MEFGEPEAAFEDFFFKSFPQYRMDRAVEDFARLCFYAGLAWSHVRIKADIESDLMEIDNNFVKKKG